jgi:hypothetical protein
MSILTQGPNSASHLTAIVVSFLGVKRPRRDTDHLLLSSAEFMNVWSYTSTPPYAFATCTGTTLSLPLYLRMRVEHRQWRRDVENSTLEVRDSNLDKVIAESDDSFVFFSAPQTRMLYSRSNRLWLILSKSLYVHKFVMTLPYHSLLCTNFSLRNVIK